MAIRAVLFDLGNTIVRFDVDSQEEAFHRILASLGVSKSMEGIKVALVDAEQEAKALGLLSLCGKIQCEEYWHRWDSLVLKHLGITGNEGLAKIVHVKWFDLDCAPYPEVKEVLLKLKQMGLKIGLISAAYEEEISLVLGRANLEEEIFDVIVGADTIQKVKPHPDVFIHALRVLKSKPDETIFVGDKPDVDYMGAQNVGLQAILLDRRENKQEHGLKTIKNLKEIFDNIS